MFGLNTYLILGAVVAIGVALGGAYFKGRNDGRSALLRQMQEDRIAIFKDGQKIDEEVIGADDVYLCQLLGGCAE